MKTALILSSFVAASRVGATASAFCLRRLGVETLVLPTTVLGRHPGWGTPGGQALDTAHLQAMWDAIKKQNIHIDAVMTGYLASDTHINLALDIMADVKARNPKAIIVVDPVMGDHGQLYIPESRANALKNRLVPKADVITPNAWELSYITNKRAGTLSEIRQATANLAMQSLITSVPLANEIGALLTLKNSSYLVRHQKFKTVPHGGGDALAATFLAHLLNGKAAPDSLAQSVASIFAVLKAAVTSDAGELPLIRQQQALMDAKPLTLELL